MSNFTCQKRNLLSIVITLLSLCMAQFSLPCFAEKSTSMPAVMKVGITHNPPFSIIENHHYRGISVDVWKLIAKKLGYNYHFVEISSSVDQSVLDLSKGLLDILVGPVTMTSSRSTLISFSRPYAINYVGIVVPVINKPFKDTIFLFIQKFLSWTILIAVLGFALYIHAVWFLERGKLAGISTSYREGISFLFWSTLYGIGLKKLPTTYAGKITYFFWVICKGALLSLITAAIITSLHYSYLDKQVKIDPEVDRFATLAGGASYHYANIAGYDLIPVKTIEIGINMVLNKTVTGYIEDMSAAYYYLQEHHLFNQLELSKTVIKTSLLGIGIPTSSHIRHVVNQTIASMQENGVILNICKKYIGEMKARAVCF